tara:strand:- start:77 stop:232 length:156 start_codon:yes stop_codon:yes gene_type:complete
MSPHDAWNLDFVELSQLFDYENNNIDVSFMLNFERLQNGATKDWLNETAKG